MSRRHILQSTATVSVFTAASRVLGLVREIMMAVAFGTGLAKSAFDIAFKIPNLFRRLFGEGALSAAFVPVFSETLEREGEAAARRLGGRVFALLASVLMLVTAAGVLLSLAAARYVALPARFSVMFSLLAILLPYMLFICLTALAMGMLHTRRRFAVPAATPILLNTIWILSLLVLSPLFGEAPEARIRGVAWGVLAAGAIQLAVQFPALSRAGLLPDFRGGLRPDARVTRMLRLMGPAAVGAGLHEINVVLDAGLALSIGAWAPAALTYAERLIYLPLGVLATALGTVLLPTFSRHAAQGRRDEMAGTFEVSLCGLLLVMLPIAVLVVVLAGPLVALVFEWRGGAFDADSTVLTARAVRWYAPGLVVFSLHKVLVPAFHAVQDTRTPMRVGARAILLNVVLNVVFVLTWPEGYQHAGLAFASVLSQATGAIWLGLLLSRRLPGVNGRRLAGLAARAGVAALLAGLVATHAYEAVETLLPGTDKGMQALRLAAAMGGGGLAYLAAILVCCRREMVGMRARRRGV